MQPAFLEATTQGTAIKNKARYKAMKYVFAKKNRHHIVDVKEETNNTFTVRYEEPLEPGMYYNKIFEKTEYLEEEIQDAMHQLLWIAEGNEFPTP